MDEWVDYFNSLGFEYTYLGITRRNRETGEEMKELEKVISTCTRCKLHTGRTKTVPGEGDSKSKIVFVGEAPGADEDRQGRPFVGRAGQLLTRMIRAMGLSRHEVFICNILKCRPPENRDPEPDEVQACLGHLERQLELINPEVIVAVGRIAAHVLTGSAESITRMRGHWYTYRGIPVMPILHPSYLLRQPARKREAWDDLKKVMERVGLPLPDTRGQA